MSADAGTTGHLPATAGDRRVERTVRAVGTAASGLAPRGRSGRIGNRAFGRARAEPPARPSPDACNRARSGAGAPVDRAIAAGTRRGQYVLAGGGTPARGRSADGDP